MVLPPGRSLHRRSPGVPLRHRRTSPLGRVSPGRRTGSGGPPRTACPSSSTPTSTTASASRSHRHRCVSRQSTVVTTAHIFWRLSRRRPIGGDVEGQSLVNTRRCRDTCDVVDQPQVDHPGRVRDARGREIVEPTDHQRPARTRHLAQHLVCIHLTITGKTRHRLTSDHRRRAHHPGPLATADELDRPPGSQRRPGELVDDDRHLTWAHAVAVSDDGQRGSREISEHALETKRAQVHTSREVEVDRLDVGRELSCERPTHAQLSPSGTDNELPVRRAEQQTSTAVAINTHVMTSLEPITVTTHLHEEQRVEAVALLQRYLAGPLDKCRGFEGA